MTVLDLEKDGAIMSLSKDMSYSDYLSLDPILGAQKLQSAAHYEMLFIIQHQTSELWMRLCLHELSIAHTHLIKQEIDPAMKMLARVARIFEQLNSAWDVLRRLCQIKLARDGQGTFIVLPNDKIFPILSRNDKVVQKVVLRPGFTGIKQILYNNYKYLSVICGAQKRASNF